MLLSFSELYSVFFFQAEDGIRDDLVTGVQTCALPISEIDVGASQESAGNGVGHEIVVCGVAVRRGGQLRQPRLGDGILEIRTDDIQNAIAAELLTGPWMVNGVRPVGEISGALLEGGVGEVWLGGAAVLLRALP